MRLSRLAVRVRPSMHSAVDSFYSDGLVGMLLARERLSGARGVRARQLAPPVIPGHHLRPCFDPAGIVARVALGLHSEEAFVFSPTKTGLAWGARACKAALSGLKRCILRNTKATLSILYLLLLKMLCASWPTRMFLRRRAE